ncbi:MAG: polyprenol monophosphomannose synthase [Acidimicrobiales bacterium]
MRRLLVLPTYEEAGNVSRVLEEVRAVDPVLDILVVDDASPDGTAGIAAKEATRLGGVEVLTREGKKGLGSAYRAGFAWGLARGYDVLLEMDADFSHDPADLPRLIGALEEGFDLAIGSRYVPGGSIPAWSWHRRALSRGGNRYARTLLGIDVADMTAGFRAYRASLLSRVPLDRVAADGYGFQIEMVREVIRAGGRVVELPIAFSERTEGRSKMSGWIVVEALVSVTRWGVADRVRRLVQASTQAARRRR